jgi:hypothetical protein
MDIPAFANGLSFVACDALEHRRCSHHDVVINLLRQKRRTDVCGSREKKRFGKQKRRKITVSFQDRM